MRNNEYTFVFEPWIFSLYFVLAGLVLSFPPPGVIEACSERGDTQGALDTLQMMRGAAAATATVGVCPRPSYRSYLAALRACSRASPPPPPSPLAAVTVAAPGDAGEVRANGAGAVHVCGDWRASKKVLGMMWEDEAARMAEGRTAVPGRLMEGGRGGA